MSRVESLPDAGSSYRVAVVGGGISGLSAAHALHERATERGLPLDLRVFEATERLGGQIRTERRDGLLLECGPDSLVAQKPAGQALCRRIGLGGELIGLDAGEGTFRLAHGGRLLPLPTGFKLIAPTRVGPLLGSELFSWPGKLRLALERFVPARPAGREDESLRGFVVRRFGREAFERVAEPVMAGLFTADGDAMSLRLTAPRFLDLERAHGSVTRGLARSAAGAAAPRPGAGFFSLRTGMGTLVERLARRLPDGCVRTSSAVTALEQAASSNGWIIRSAGQEAFAAHAVVLAGPAYASAAVLRQADGELSGQLDSLGYASCATVQLVYDTKQIGGALNGYGFFVPRSSGLPALACNYMSVRFPGRAPEDQVLLRVFLGGAGRPSLDGVDDDGLASMAHGSVAGLLSIDGAPRMQLVRRFPRSMPQFPVGYADTAARIRASLGRHPGLFLCGGALGSVGLPDCIARGEDTARELIDFVASPARSLELAI